VVSLFLAILCSAAIALVLKFSEVSGKNRYRVTTINYLVAFSASGVAALLSLPPIDAVFFPSWFGILTGFLFVGSFVFYQLCIAKSGAGLSGTFGKMGILIPAFLSLLVWKEFPSQWQWMGVGFALLAILLVTFPGRRSQKGFHALLLVLLLLNGFAEFFNKVFQKFAAPGTEQLFLFWVFFSAFVISLLLSRKSQAPSRSYKDWITGFFVGVPNLLSSFFLIRSLNQLSATVVFPVYSAGSAAVIILGSRLFFSEKLSPLQWSAVGAGIISLVLANL